ncbi:hypothetical protein VTH8203_01581 [Vibrio thalassae]|uniref:Metalloprotease StcE beta-sandwich domain-containing protein n=1 Tax=Vibrio thalassae TaxID=1243014 RepID=A0A240EHE7_9VIBR|nr:hypothetical protein [Vibrio thalassae]SNX47966.1 hypothetical protein VTH8203_01581 [Vibrio thalassae]
MIKKKFLPIFCMMIFSFVKEVYAETTWIPISNGGINLIVPYVNGKQFQAPINIEKTKEDGRSIVSWDDIEHASQYQVQGQNANGNWITILTVKSSSFEINSLFDWFNKIRIIACNYYSCDKTGLASISFLKSNFESLDVKRVISTFDNQGFLYSVMPKSNRIGLLSYDKENTIDISISDLNFDALQIIECGSSNGFIERTSVHNHENLTGDTGYERFKYPCHIARNNEFKWFYNSTNGRSTWYSKNLNGDLQCYSTDGRNCILKPDYSKKIIINSKGTLRNLEENPEGISEYLKQFNEVVIKTRNGAWTGNITLPKTATQGRRVSFDVNSTWPVTVQLPNEVKYKIYNGESKSYIYLGLTWIQEGENINDTPDIVQWAKPLSCGVEHKKHYGVTGYDTEGHWCEMFIKPEQSYSKLTLQSIIDSKLSHMNKLFTQMESYETLKVNNNYSYRISEAQQKMNSKFKQKEVACGDFWWNIVGLIMCGVYNDEYQDLKKQYELLVKQKDSALKSVIEKVESGRNSKFYELHKNWAQNDNTHFSVLLKEESTKLNELNELKNEYDKGSIQAHSDYLKAVEDYMNDTKPENILTKSLEDLPLIGPEIKNIVDYSDNPSKTNLRKMLLGAAGPLGQELEGIIEVSTEDSSLDNATLKFLTDVLTDLNNDTEISETLEDIVSDAINDLGDEAIESIRQAGLWRDNQAEENIKKLNYKSLIDLQSKLDRIEYDFWSGSSEQEITAQNKFTPDDFNYTDFISDPLSYDPSSLIDIEYASGGAKFENRLSSIFTHAFGKAYKEIFKLSNSNSGLWKMSDVNEELYNVIANPAYYDQRIPYWVDSSIIGHRPAGFIYNDKFSFIVINRDLVDLNSDDFYKFYFEELGHMLNWWRCKIFDVNISNCQISGDAGARFRDAVLIEERLHTVPLEILLTELPSYQDVDSNVLKFKDNSIATLDGWPNYYTMNDHIAADGSFSFLFRLGLDINSEEFQSVSDEFDLEVTINAPKPALKNDPWKKSANGYCKSDDEIDCNMPTMWVSISFRDALKSSVVKMPKVKASKYSNVGFDLSPRLVRKHIGKLPFQLHSVSSTSWKHKQEFNIYAKKFTTALEAKLDLWKMGHALKGISASKIHKPELSLKSTPASGSYLVEIASRDTKDFAGWLAADIVSDVAGCAAGFAIGVFVETDPAVLCHTMSDTVEAIESAFQGLDKDPTMIFEADSNVSIPLSLEYKYATSGSKVAGNTSPSSDTFNSGRVTTFPEDSTELSELGNQMPATSVTGNPQISSLSDKASRAFSKLAKSTISPIAVFRSRVGFTYGEKIIQKGEYALPSVIVSD